MNNKFNANVKWRWRNPMHILVIASGSGQMRIWPRISSRSRPTLIWSSWNWMRTTNLVNLLVGWCMWCTLMRCTLTNRHIELWTKIEWPISISRVLWSTKYRLDPWTVFLSCGKTFSLHFPSIPGLSVSSISCDVFSRHVRQIAKTLPRIIRVCRLLIRRELRLGATLPLPWMTISLRLRWCADSYSSAASPQDRGVKVWWGAGKWLECWSTHRAMIAQMNREEREDQEDYWEYFCC